MLIPILEEIPLIEVKSGFFAMYRSKTSLNEKTHSQGTTYTWAGRTSIAIQMGSGVVLYFKIQNEFECAMGL